MDLFPALGRNYYKIADFAKIKVKVKKMESLGEPPSAYYKRGL